MADKVTIHKAEDAAELTPTKEVTRPVTQIVIINDSRGRKISVKRPSVLAQFRLVEMLGAELGKNTMYLNMVMPVFWVTGIDGEPLYAPATKLELEAAIERLGEEGLDAVNSYILEQVDETISKEKLGNESGTPASAKP